MEGVQSRPQPDKQVLSRSIFPVRGAAMTKEGATRTPTPTRTRPPAPRKAVPLLLSCLGMVALAYLLGAAAMFFRLPTSGFLSKAFIGARAWNERRRASSRNVDRQLPAASSAVIDKPGKTFDGFTLCTYASMSTSSTQAF